MVHGGVGYSIPPSMPRTWWTISTWLIVSGLASGIRSQAEGNDGMLNIYKKFKSWRSVTGLLWPDQGSPGLAWGHHPWHPTITRPGQGLLAWRQLPSCPNRCQGLSGLAHMASCSLILSMRWKLEWQATDVGTSVVHTTATSVLYSMSLEEMKNCIRFEPRKIMGNITVTPNHQCKLSPNKCYWLEPVAVGYMKYTNFIIRACLAKWYRRT